MSKGRCVVCGEEIPSSLLGGKERGHCMHVDVLEWHPSQYPRQTTYHDLWICHRCACQIVNNIAYNDSNFGIE